MRKKEKHTNYNYQFKHTAVTITNHPDIQTVDVAEALSIHPIMLYRWRGEMRSGKIQNNDQEARSTSELIDAQKKIKQLEKELTKVRQENGVLRKAEKLFPGKKADSFRFIDEHRSQCSVAVLCRKLGVSRGGYYAWKKRANSPRQEENKRLLDKIVDIHAKSRETYGYPRVFDALRQHGETCGRHRVARLMRENNVVAKMYRRFRKHSHQHHLLWEPRNLLLNRDPVSQANEVWVGDVTYIRVGKHWNYLCTVMDLHTREIIGWSFSRKCDASLAKEALLMALQDHQPIEGAIFHTDRGTEFANKELNAVLDKHNLLVSKSRKGCCWDNANMESFYHTLKTEMVYFHRFKNLVEATAHIMDYLHFYNHERLHSSLGYQSPINYQLQAA